MFTGLVETTGALAARTQRGPGARLSITTDLTALVLGESVAVDGCCLTVDAIVPNGFEADASAETLAKTTLGALALGARVNLERAMPLGGRMGGHLVSGHVDGVGTLAARGPLGDAISLRFTMPRTLARYVAKKGSITVSGVSLTVNEVSDEAFAVVVIPRTQRDTSLGALAIGGSVNLEVDLVARYLERLVAQRDAGSDEDLMARLSRAGYV